MVYLLSFPLRSSATRLPPEDNVADPSSMQDNSGTIERDEFLSLPQISSNPLATR